MAASAEDIKTLSELLAKARDTPNSISQQEAQDGLGLIGNDVFREAIGINENFQEIKVEFEELFKAIEGLKKDSFLNNSTEIQKKFHSILMNERLGLYKNQFLKIPYNPAEKISPTKFTETPEDAQAREEIPKRAQGRYDIEDSDEEEDAQNVEEQSDTIKVATYTQTDVAKMDKETVRLEMEKVIRNLDVNVLFIDPYFEALCLKRCQLAQADTSGTREAQHELMIAKLRLAQIYKYQYNEYNKNPNENKEKIDFYKAFGKIYSEAKECREALLKTLDKQGPQYLYYSAEFMRLDTVYQNMDTYQNTQGQNEMSPIDTKSRREFEQRGFSAQVLSRYEGAFFHDRFSEGMPEAGFAYAKGHYQLAMLAKKQPTNSNVVAKHLYTAKDTLNEAINLVNSQNKDSLVPRLKSELEEVEKEIETVETSLVASDVKQKIETQNLAGVTDGRKSFTPGKDALVSRKPTSTSMVSDEYVELTLKERQAKFIEHVNKSLDVVLDLAYSGKINITRASEANPKAQIQFANESTPSFVFKPGTDECLIKMEMPNAPFTKDDGSGKMVEDEDKTLVKGKLIYHQLKAFEKQEAVIDHVYPEDTMCLLRQIMKIGNQEEGLDNILYRCKFKDLEKVAKLCAEKPPKAKYLDLLGPEGIDEIDSIINKIRAIQATEEAPAIKPSASMSERGVQVTTQTATTDKGNTLKGIRIKKKGVWK